MGFRFKKNERGWSEITFPFMRRTIIPSTRFLYNVRTTGREHMPVTGPCFIYGNHSNYFDPFSINVELKKEPTAGIMTRDQFHKTIPRIFMDSIGIVPTSKYIPEPGVIRQVIRMIDQKRMIVIFPEGGRRWDGRPKSIVEATIKLFWRMGIPVHPVQIHGSHLGWPRWARYPRRNSTEVRWLPPLRVSDFENFEDFFEKCLSNMDFDEYNPPSETLPFQVWKPAEGIERILYRCPESAESGALFTYGGDRVASRTSAFDCRVDANSRLIDRHGEVLSLQVLYDRVRSMPMVRKKGGVLLEETGCRFYTIDDEQNLVGLGEGAVRLLEECVEYLAGSEKGIIPIEKIRYLSVEQAHKFSITDEKRTLQFTMDGSALQWQHYLKRLQKGEKAI